VGGLSPFIMPIQPGWREAPSASLFYQRKSWLPDGCDLMGMKRDLQSPQWADQPVDSIDQSLVGVALNLLVDFGALTHDTLQLQGGKASPANLRTPDWLFGSSGRRLNGEQFRMNTTSSAPLNKIV
jgi:hypothetical protein